MEDNTITDDLLSKMQKLLNMQEGAAAVGNVHEAEAAASRLQALLMKHNLDLETIKAHSIDKKAKMENARVDTGSMADKRESDWVTKLYNGVAQGNMCRVFSDRGYVHIFGHATNVALVLYIAEQLTAKVRIAEKLSWAQYDKQISFDKEKRGTYRRGFFEGAAYGIAERLRQDLKGYKNPANGNPYALMIVHKEDEVNEYLYDLYPYLRPETVQQRSDRLAKEANEEREILNAMSESEREKYLKKKNKVTKGRMLKGPKGLSSTDGWRTGHEVGKKMNINKGLDSNNTQHLN